MILIAINKTDGRLAVNALGTSLNAGETKQFELARKKVANILDSHELGELIRLDKLELVNGGMVTGDPDPARASYAFLVTYFT